MSRRPRSPPARDIIQAAQNSLQKSRATRRLGRRQARPVKIPSLGGKSNSSKTRNRKSVRNDASTQPQAFLSVIENAIFGAGSVSIPELAQIVFDYFHDSCFRLVFRVPAGDLSVRLPFYGEVRVKVEWGDGKSDAISAFDQQEVTHLYAGPGDYTVSILGDMTGFGFGKLETTEADEETKSRHKLVDIQHWGCVHLGDRGGQFFECTNLGWVRTSDAPDLRGVNMSYMFAGAPMFVSDLSHWDVGEVTSMGCFFKGATSFESDLSQWDVSNVTDMTSMFHGLICFESDLSQWGVSRVKKMGSMLQRASLFNSDLSQWDVRRVTNMSYMFYGASSFQSDLSQWNVSRVTNMTAMFQGAHSFQSNLLQWNIRRVITMHSMFNGASSFQLDFAPTLNSR